MDENQSLIRSLAARRKYLEYDYDIVKKSYKEDGMVSLGIADACLLHASFPLAPPRTRKPLNQERLRAVGKEKYADAGKHLSDFAPASARASWYLAENFSLAEESLRSLNKEFFS